MPATHQKGQGNSSSIIFPSKIKMGEAAGYHVQKDVFSFFLSFFLDMLTPSEDLGEKLYPTQLRPGKLFGKTFALAYQT